MADMELVWVQNVKAMIKASPMFSDGMRERCLARFNEALEARSEAVRVEPLEWQTRDPYGAIWFARTACGAEYRVMHEQWWSPDSTRAHPCRSNEAAKAEAQADYEARIRSALAPSTTHTGPGDQRRG